MDSVLELDRQEVKHIKDTLAQNKDLFIQNAAPLFEDCFHLLLSSGAKPDTFNLLKSLSDPNNQQSAQLNEIYNAILVICTQIFKVNLKGQEEFSHIIDELGLRSKAQELMKVFQTAYLKRIDQLANVYDDEQASMTQQYSKKFPLNLAVQDDNLQVTNSRVVDIEWKILYQLSSKNLNKLFQYRFLITLIVLSNGDFFKGGAVEETKWSSKRDYMMLKKVQFECDHEELAHLLYKVKSACNSLETMLKKQ